MKIGTLDVEKVYLGNTLIEKIALGDTTIYDGGTTKSITFANFNDNLDVSVNDGTSQTITSFPTTIQVQKGDKINYEWGTSNSKQAYIYKNYTLTPDNDVVYAYTHSSNNNIYSMNYPLNKITDLKNANIEGTLINDNKGGFSGFSTSNYIKVLDGQTLDFNTNNYEIYIHFKTGSNVTSNQALTGQYPTSGIGGQLMQVYNNNIYFNYNAQTDAIFVENFTLQPNTEYWAKAEKVDNTYTLTINDGTNTGTVNKTDSSYTTSSRNLTFGLFAPDPYNYVFGGTIYMYDSYVKVGSTTYTFGDLVFNCDFTLQNATTTGNIQQTNGIYKGFSYSPSRYLTLSNSFDPQNATWEMMFKFKPYVLPSDMEGIICKSYNTYYGTSILIHSSGKLAYHIQLGGSTSTDSLQFVGTHSFSINNWNYVKIAYDGSGYDYYYSDDGQTWEPDHERVSSSQTMYSWNAPTAIGVHLGRQEAFNGEIDMVSSYIKIGDTTTTFGNLQTHLYDSNFQELVVNTAPIIEDGNIIIDNTTYERNPDGDTTVSQFFAYTDGNNNTIYTPDVNLQGTFKSLNTNDFENIGSTISIDSNGIATCGGYAETSYFKSKTALFGTGTNDNWQIHSRMAYRENLADNTNLYGVHPWVEFKDVILFKSTSDISTIALEIGDGSAVHDINYSGAGPTAINEFFTSDLIGYANGTSFKTNNSFGETTSYKVNFSGNGSYFGRANILLDLTDTYCVSNGKKTTLAIMNTTSTVYNSSWQQLSGAEHYNNVIKVNNVVYTRDSSKDITKT